MKKRAFIVLALVLLALAQLFHCQIKYLPAALMQTVADDYAVSITAIGMVVSACTVASGFSPILASLVIDRKGSIFSMACSALLVGLTGILPCLFHSYPLLIASYLFCGAGIGFSFCTTPVMIAEWIPAKFRSVALSISFAFYNAFVSLSYSAPSLMIGGVASWRVLLFVWSVLSLLVCGGLMLLGRCVKDTAAPPAVQAAPKQRSGLMQALRIPSVCILSVVMACFIWVNNTYATFLPNFLEQVRNASAQQSGLITSVSFTCGILGCLFSGVLSTRLRHFLLYLFPVLMLLAGVGIGLLQDFLLLACCSGLFGFAYQGWVPAAYAVFMADRRMNSRTLGGATALFDGLGHVLTLLIPAVYGLFIRCLGMPLAMLLTAAVLVPAVLLQLVFRKKLLSASEKSAAVSPENAAL